MVAHDYSPRTAEAMTEGLHKLKLEKQIDGYKEGGAWGEGGRERKKTCFIFLIKINK